MKRIVSRGILTLSLVVVLLAAMASSASAFTTLFPMSTNFGDRQVGTTSPPQAFTLTVNRTCIIFQGCFSDSLAVAPSVSPEFARTHNCPAVLFVAANDPVNKSCTINVTFTPLSTGPKTGMLCTNGTATATSCLYRLGVVPGPSATLTGNGVTFPTPPTPPTPGPAVGPGGTPVFCKGKPATIVGTNGNDVSSGTPARDVMVGLGGNDSLSGLAGNDLICGGKGKDNLNGGKGKDKLYGQKGKDKLRGKAGKDLCVGGPGKDIAKACEKTKSI
jgi:hypothetical protein